MKHGICVALLLAAGASAIADTKKTPSPIGFYRVKLVIIDGKKMDLAEELKADFRRQDPSYEFDFLRMTIDIEPKELTVGVDQVIGPKGSASYCRVRATTQIAIANNKFTLPGMRAAANGGTVKVTSQTSKTTKDETSKSTKTRGERVGCNVSLDPGVYTIKGGDKELELSMISEGKKVVLQLVADTRDVDLEARANTFAAR